METGKNSCQQLAFGNTDLATWIKSIQISIPFVVCLNFYGELNKNHMNSLLYV